MGWKRKGKERGGPVCTPQILLFRPFFDISIVYAKYLEHTLGSAAKMIINITLVDDFMTFQHFKLQKPPSPVNQITI